VNNAIKFTNQGSVNLKCEIKNIEHDIVQFVFKIKDTGIGIPADKINTIFERFNQGNAETTRKYGGTGLGLAIVKQLVEIQNGDITLKSKEGVGSEFIITISYPISYQNTIIPLENKNIPLKINSEKPLYILLAEDNILNQKLASIYLTDFGLHIDIAENGLDALEKVKKKNYDLILMDIQMPLLDGYMTTKKIREDYKMNMPIIAMTAYIMPNEHEKCLSFGMSDYISKPFKEIELFDIVNKYIGDKTNTDTRKLEDNSITDKPISSSNSSVIIDTEQLHSISRGDNKLLKDIIHLFLEQNPVELNQIESAINSNDYATIRAISHKMKTSVGFMGMNCILTELTQLESFAEKKIPQKEINLIFISIKQKCLLAIIELEKELIKIA
jgi:CheY-like chemotaxis protein